VQVLHAFGQDSVASKVLQRTEAPSFNFMLEQGPGTIWETWDGGASRSHPMFCGGVGLYLYTLAGVEVDEMPATVGVSQHQTIMRVPTTAMRQALQSAAVLYRGVHFSWVQGSNNMVAVDLDVPYTACEGDTAVTVRFPAGAVFSNTDEGAAILAGGDDAQHRGVSRVLVDELGTTVLLQGGHFSFTFESTEQ